MAKKADPEEFTLTADPPSETPKQGENQEIDIKTPEQWPAANDVRGMANIEIACHQAQFDVRAVSQAEWNESVKLYPLPAAPMVRIGRLKRQNVNDPEYLERLGMAQLKRIVHVIELAWHEFEGESIDAKVAWVLKNICREIDPKALFLEIRRVSGFGLSEQNRELDEKKVSISSPSDWARLTKRDLKFRITHSDKVLVFTLRGIPGTRLKEINQECTPPKPPERPIRTPGSTKITGSEPDFENPLYQDICQKLQAQRDMMILEESLGFKFPGATADERLAWLGARPCDEINEMRSFVEFVVAGLEERADFFTG